MEQKQNSSDKIFTSPLHPPGVSFYHSLSGVQTPPTVRMKSDVFEVDFENHFQIWVNIYYSTTWLVSAGPSTAAPRAPRPSPMIPPSIAAFPVEKI